MPVNKIVVNRETGEEVLIDLTGDTVTPETLAEGVIAHDASGKVIVGTGGSYDLDIDYDALLAFDTSEIIIDVDTPTTSAEAILDEAILDEVVLA